MKIIKYGLLGIVCVSVTGLIAAYLFVQSIATRAIPDYNGAISLKGITETVTVYRDSYAVPHVFARNEHDLYVAVGYIMAEDRLWQMDLLRRATTGRLAEIFGETLVETDLFLRSLRMPEKSRMILDQTDTRTLSMLEAFCDGVNQYIDRHAERLPPEFVILKYTPEKWKPEHSLNLGSFMALDLTTAWKSEIVIDKLRRKLGEDMIRALIPDMSRQRAVVYPEGGGATPALLEPLYTLVDHARVLQDLGLAVFAGSNNWAVAGKRSATGKPILANDMHLGLNCPGIWYQMHQVVEGDFSVTGVVLPGQPCVIAGHNDRIAWGFTNVMADDMDFYLEQINPDNPAEYRYETEWHPLETREETIRIRDKEPVVRNISFTHRGPIISKIKRVSDHAISLRWIGNEFSNEMRTVALLRRVKNWDDFCDAFKTFGATSQNAIYADVDGNIGMYCAALVPIRSGENAIRIAPGWTGEYDWQGMVPPTALPHLYNPSGGIVSSANNRSADETYPYYISRWFAPPQRIERIREMLTEKQLLSLEDFKRMQADHYSTYAHTLSSEIARVAVQSATAPSLEQQALVLLSAWDGMLARPSAAAAIFETFYCMFIRNVFADEMGDELFREYFSTILLHRHAFDNVWHDRKAAWYANIKTTGTRETFDDIVRQSMRDAVAYLKETLGDNPVQWQWGRLHRLMLRHPLGEVKALDAVFDLNRGHFEVGGSWHTVNNFSYDVTAPYETDFGVSQRHIYSLADWNDSLSVIPTGISGIPASDHYCDQTRLYLTHTYHRDLVDRKLIEEDARYTMIIKGEK